MYHRHHHRPGQQIRHLVKTDHHLQSNQGDIKKRTQMVNYIFFLVQTKSIVAGSLVYVHIYQSIGRKPGNFVTMIMMMSRPTC